MSAFTVSLHHGTYALAVASGPALICDALGLLEMVGRVTKEQGNDRALLDMISVEILLTPAEHVRVGEHAAAALGHLTKVAAVVPESLRVGTGERAAQDKGLILKTFTNLSDAMAWLEEASAGH